MIEKQPPRLKIPSLIYIKNQSFSYLRIMKKALLLFLFTSLLSISAMNKDYNIAYKISFPNANTHYVRIDMTVWGIKESELILKLPVWTPGSYLVREFSKNIDKFEIKNSTGIPVAYNKTAKNTWQVFTTGQKEITIGYEVYAYELSVRTSFVDDEQAYLNGANIFLYIENGKDSKSSLTFFPRDEWKQISTPLKALNGNKWAREAANYDELVDSPILIGNQHIIRFNAENVPHEIAMQGYGNYNESILVNDLQRIIAVENSMFGTKHPCDHYTFLIHNTEKQGGGLEHLYASSNMIPRWNYGVRDKYLSAISLLAHEYFHLWNVKRIRPTELGPFKYDEENYTRLLWVAEGITSYYDDYFVFRAGISSKEEYLRIVSDNLTKLVNSPGDKVQSLSESSFDTWIKYYRPNENSNNATISYYTKGAFIATVLNFTILDATDGKKSLDDVMKLLWEQYLKRPEKGYNEEELRMAFENVSGLKLKDFFDQYIYKPGVVDYQKYFNLVGLELINANQNKQIVTLGIATKFSEGKLIITSVEKGSSAENAGLYVNDEIIGMDGYRAGEDWNKWVETKKEGDKIMFTISRYGILKNIEAIVQSNKKVDYKIAYMQNPTPKQLKLREIWLTQSKYHVVE